MNKKEYMMLKDSKLLNERGVSLIECMVAFLIFSFVAAGLYAASLAGENSWVINNARLQMQKELRNARDRIKNDLQQANSTEINNAEVSGFDKDSVEFFLPNPGESSGFNDDQKISYQLGGTDNDELHRVLIDFSNSSNNTDYIIAHDIQSLDFDESLGPVSVTITAQKTTEKGQDLSYTVEFEVNPRN